MDTIPEEIVTIILDCVYDTRAYSRTNRLARTQCAARPDYAVWQKIHSVNDYFVCGTADIFLWARENVPEIKSLDEIGFVCGLKNAARADNAEILTQADIRRISAHCSGPKTLALLDKYNIPRSVYPAEFRGLKEREIREVIASNLSDDHLIGMLGNLRRGQIREILSAACKYGRHKLALAVVEGYGVEHIWPSLRKDISHSNYKLVQLLSSMTSADCGRVPMFIANNAVLCGRAAEFDEDSDYHRMANEVFADAQGKGTGYWLGSMSRELDPVVIDSQRADSRAQTDTNTRSWACSPRQNKISGHQPAR